MRVAAKRRGVTLNDLLLRDLFLAVRPRTEPPARGGGSTGDEAGFLRVTVPVNLRGPLDLPGPASPESSGGGLGVANRIGLAPVTRPPADCDDPAALLASVHAEMAWVRRVERGRRYLEAAALLQRLHGVTPPRIMGEGCLATAVLSNLGDLSRVIPPALRDDPARLHVPPTGGRGALTVLSHRTAPPVRPLTRATVLAATYAGRLTLHLGRDPHSFSPEDAAALLGDLAARVRASAAQSQSD